MTQNSADLIVSEAWNPATPVRVQTDKATDQGANPVKLHPDSNQL